MNSFRLVSAAVAAACIAHSAAASAQPPRTDGIYHRFDGDLSAQLDLGMAVADANPAASARITLRYLQTAGLYAHYTDDFRSELSAASRALATGVELRPLFLPRTSYDLERGPAWLDLFVDSFSLRCGAVFGRRPGLEARAPGLELGLGLGLPLTRSAAGPWLDASASLRFAQTHLAGESSTSLRRDSLVALSVGWQGFLDANIVDAGDGLRR